MILGVESSCDESALALFDPARGLVGEWVHTQIDLHRAYGGVVPDLASREHLTNFDAMLRCVPPEQFKGIKTVAVTRGPGLAGCLAMGMALAKAVALYKGVPLLGVNHLRAHAWSPFIATHANAPEKFSQALAELLPHLGLLVSGGNTILFTLTEVGAIEPLGQTLDDAAGEALDKGAKLLGLPYPGGPEVEKLAKEGDPAAYDFPRARPKGDACAFSFSGLKTSLRYRLEGISDAELAQRLPDLCASYQEAVIDQLAARVGERLGQGAYRSVGLSGGVANNEALRGRLQNLTDEAGVPLLCAQPKHTGDNAGMIAFAAAQEGTSLPQGLGMGIAPALRLQAY